MNNCTSGSGSDSQMDPGTPVRLSKRKRKAPPLPDELPSTSNVAQTWSRMALQSVPISYLLLSLAL